MEKDSQIYDDIIESYISLYLDKGQYPLELKTAAPSDIEMRLTRNALLDEEEEEGVKLLEAAAQGDDFIVIELLESNPNLIWYRDTATGNMVLHVVAKGGHKSTLIKLMDFINKHKHSTFRSKSPVLELNHLKNSALHLALENCHKELVSALVNAMPPEFVYATNELGINMPINLAIKAGFKDIVEDMLQRAPWRSISENTRQNLMHSSIVHDAILAKDLGLLQLVLENMPTLINSRFQNWRPLQYAAYKGRLEEFWYLKNFEEEKCNKHHSLLPIHIAIAGNQLEIVKEFISHCPEIIDLVDKRGRTPLSLAAELGYTDQVCYFLTNFSKSVSKCDKDGSFPIHKAVVYGHIDVVKKFVSRCPESIYHVDGRGRSILHHVVTYARADVLCYLKTLHEIKKLYHIRDANGDTFVDLINKKANPGLMKEQGNSQENLIMLLQRLRAMRR